MSNDRSPQTVKGRRSLTTSNSPGNAAAFLVEQSLRRRINTADVVRIDQADQNGSEGPAGHAAATPLVCMTDGRDNIVQQARISRMPYYRPQAGKAALIMDPQPGDKALAVFAKHDSSNLKVGKSDPVQPGSFRSFDQADGFLLNGFLGETPEIWLHLNPVSGDISLSTKAAHIDISCREEGDIVVRTGKGNITVQAGDDASGTITLDGKVVVTRTLEVLNKLNEESSRFHGGLRNTGGIINEGGILNKDGIVNEGGLANQGGSLSSNGVILETHTHYGVEGGLGNTGLPNR